MACAMVIRLDKGSSLYLPKRGCDEIILLLSISVLVVKLNKD